MSRMGCAGRRVVGQLEQRQVGVAEDAGQQVVEVVRDAAGQHAEALELLRVAHLLLAAPAFVEQARVADGDGRLSATPCSSDTSSAENVRGRSIAATPIAPRYSPSRNMRTKATERSPNPAMARICATSDRSTSSMTTTPTSADGRVPAGKAPGREVLEGGVPPAIAASSIRRPVGTCSKTAARFTPSASRVRSQMPCRIAGTSRCC